MTKYAFTAKPVEGYEHRNPTYWSVSSPPTDATEVIVDPEFPEIAKHFGDLVKSEKKAPAKSGKGKKSNG